MNTAFVRLMIVLRVAARFDVMLASRCLRQSNQLSQIVRPAPTQTHGAIELFQGTTTVARSAGSTSPASAKRNFLRSACSPADRNCRRPQVGATGFRGKCDR